VAHLVEAEHHDLEEERFLALEMVVEAGLRQAERAGDVADRRGVVAAVAKQLGDSSIHGGTPRVGPVHRRQSLSRHLQWRHYGAVYRPVGRSLAWLSRTAQAQCLLILNANTNFWTRVERRLKNRTKAADKPQTIPARLLHNRPDLRSYFRCNAFLGGRGMRTFARFISGAALVALLPGSAWAQTSAIAGTVKDTSGAVLPGVTVEASSPALIEKVRSAVSEGNGQYKIEALRPGTYTVTFTLPGFSVVKRENVELTSDFTATINADLKVGALEETITVSAESPVVDVQNITTRTVMTREVLDSIPTGRNIQAIGIMIPGTSISVGG